MHKNRVCVEEEREVGVEEKCYLFNSVQSVSHVQLFATPWTTAPQGSLSIILKLMSVESMMSSNRLILCHPLLLLPSIFPTIRVFSNESALRIRWPKYWSFSFNIISRTDFLSDGLVYLLKIGYFQKVTFSGKTGNQNNPNSEKNLEATHMALKKSPVIRVYVWLSPFAVHLKLSQHCLLIGYTPIQNKLK